MLLKHHISLQRCRQLHAAASREGFTESIFNGEEYGEKPKRFHARGDSWAPVAERDLTKVLANHGLLECSRAGATKTAADLAALKSLACEVEGDAALARRQPAHTDAAELDDRERRQWGLKPLAELDDRDQPQRQATGFESYTFPQNHQQIFDSRNPNKNTVGRITMPGRHSCARCSALAQRDGEMGYYYLEASKQPCEMVRKMPKPWAIGTHGEPIHNIPASRWGCSICRVWLCKDCFRMEDAQGKPLPDAWDHRAATRGLLARCVVCE